jgi:hypothetical protein
MLMVYLCRIYASGCSQGLVQDKGDSLLLSSRGIHPDDPSPLRLRRPDR